MSKGLIVLVVLVLIVLVLVGQYVSVRNQLVAKDQAVKAAWSQVDIVLQRRADLRLPRGAQRVVLEQGEVRTLRLFLGRSVEVGKPAAPLPADLAQQRERLLDAVFEQLGRGDLAGVVALAERQLPRLEERLEAIEV